MRISSHAWVRRLRRYEWHVAQCACAAALAWVLARQVLGHPQPFFAPVAAIVCLGLSYGQRLRRVAELTAGVALGILVGDGFAHLFGTGPWQVLVVVLLAMTVAVLLDAGPMVITQAGVQSAIVTTLAPTAQSGLGRWLDAVCGGLVALVAAAVVPGSPLRRPRLAAAHVARELSVWLHDAATAARTGDRDLAHRTLERARDSEPALDELRLAAREGLDVATASPLRRQHRGDMREVSGQAVPLDHAVRNVRVLLRRVVVVTRLGEQLPDQLLDLLDGLGDAAAGIADELTAQRTPTAAQDRLTVLARASAQIPVGRSLSADVLLAQVRSVVVDLLELSGVDTDTAQSLVPPPGSDRAGT